MNSRARTRSASRDSGLGDSQQSSQDDSASQEDYVPVKRPRKTPRARPAQWVCVMPDALLSSSTSPSDSGGGGPTFVALRQPRTGSLGRFLLSGNQTRICEVLKFSDEPRSWFIGNSIQTDGSLFMCTPIDPLFLALPYVIKAAKAGKFTTLDAILEDTACDCAVIEKCLPAEQWQHVCNIKVLQSGTRVYRYSQEKTIKWLRKKVEVLPHKLEEVGVYTGTGSCSSVFIRSKRQPSVSKEHYLHYACGMVCDYLPEPLAEELMKAYSLPLDTTRKSSRDGGESVASSEDLQPTAKKPRMEPDEGIENGCDDPLEDYSKFVVPTAPAKAVSKLTQRQKALAKVDKSGMKSLANFFGSKAKKKS